MIKGVVLGPLYHRRGCNCLQWRPVKLDGDCVQRDIVLTGYSRSWRIRSQPSSELVASGGELRPIRSHGVIFEIDFLTRRWLRSRMSTQRITPELDNRAQSVHVRTPIEGIGASVRPSRCRTADAKCDDTQCNRREYEECCDDFFHRF